MKLVYTSENRILVNMASNLLENADIQTTLKNEFAGGAVGELSVFESWLELWILHDRDYERAKILLDRVERGADELPWECHRCQEQNEGTFDHCWQCQMDRDFTQSAK